MTGRKEKLKRFIKLNVVLPLFAGFLGTFSAILEECSPLCFGGEEAFFYLLAPFVDAAKKVRF